MGELASLTSPDNYYEDFEVGQVIRHARGKTMTELENVNITNMVMNTAQGHFNADQMSKTPLGKILCYGGVNFSLVLGLASQVTVENALAELSLELLGVGGDRLLNHRCAFLILLCDDILLFLVELDLHVGFVLRIEFVAAE